MVSSASTTELIEKALRMNRSFLSEVPAFSSLARLCPRANLLKLQAQRLSYLFSNHLFQLFTEFSKMIASAEMEYILEFVPSLNLYSKTRIVLL